MARAMATAGLAPPPLASTPRFRLGLSRPPPSRRPRRVVVRAKSARYPASVRAPMPLPEAVATGLSCAVSGSRAALASPSDAWKPLTAATLVTALALESAGFFAAYALLHPDDDAGVVSSVVGTLALAATDVAWLLVAPVVAVAVVQQVLPLLGEKLFFDGMRATAAPGPRAAARLDALLASPGLGLRGLGVAAGRGQSLGAFAAAAAPAGLLLSLAPGVGQVLAFALATWTAAYALAWELLDPYFDKAELAFEDQERVVWDNRAALVSFAAPFAAALAVPVVGPTLAAVAQSAAGELAWRVLEVERDEEEGAEERGNEDGG